jgi:hypothetical protein
MGDDKKAGKQFLVLIGESNFKELSKLCAKGPLDPDLMSYENAGGNTALLVAAQVRAILNKSRYYFIFNIIFLLYVSL